jgi:hypothetical protein
MTKLSQAQLKKLGLTPAKPARIKEADIQAQVKDWLKWHGWFVIKIHQSLGSYKGIADLYALKDGVNIWIEIKTAKGVISEYQQKFETNIMGHGGSYMVIRSVEALEKAVEFWNGRAKNGS